MADDTTARVAAELDYLRSVGDAAQAGPEGFDTPALLARFGKAVDAVDAVLKLADEWSYGDTRSTSVTDGAWGRAQEYSARRIRKAVRRELLGETEAGDA